MVVTQQLLYTQAMARMAGGGQRNKQTKNGRVRFLRARCAPVWLGRGASRVEHKRRQTAKLPNPHHNQVAAAGRTAPPVFA